MPVSSRPDGDAQEGGTVECVLSTPESVLRQTHRGIGRAVREWTYRGEQVHGMGWPIHVGTLVRNGSQRTHAASVNDTDDSGTQKPWKSARVR